VLQLHALNRAILGDPNFWSTLAPDTGDALERRVDAAIERLRLERARRANHAGGFSKVAVAIDAALRTDAVEHMDEPGYSERGKLAIALGLHLMHLASASYRRFFGLLAPILHEVEERHLRPARVLELASGSGGFAFAAASLARRRHVNVEITGSDVVPLYVSRGQRRAAETRAPVSFRILDALEMKDVSDGAYDVVFVAQSIHHFSPGKLARMIAGSRRVATTAFVSIDGYRSLPMVAFVAGLALLSMQPAMIHDAVISVRKFYGEAELEAIARMAAPTARIEIGRLRPLDTTLTVRFDGERA
jgi:SAM-dependent methyltransferase